MMDDSEIDKLNAEVDDLEELVGRLRYERDDARENLDDVSCELHLLQFDHDMLKDEQENILRALREVREITGEALEIKSK